MQYASSHLLGGRRREDGAGDGTGEEPAPDEGGEGRLVAAAAAGDEGDLRGGERGGGQVDYFVGEVALYGGVGVGEGEEGGGDEVGGVVDEVF